MWLFGKGKSVAGKAENPGEELIHNLDLLVRIEEQIAQFYELCAETFPMDREFWEEMAQSEYRHVEFIGKMQNMIKNVPQQFKATPAFSAASIRLFEMTVRDLPDRTELERTGKKELLEMVREVEFSAVEMQYGKIVETANADFNQLASRIDAETISHHESLIAMIAQSAAQ